MNFGWSDVAFGSKKPINNLKATFIAAPREISPKRFTELLKELLPKGNVLLGLAKEDYIDGFEGQPQFRTLPAKRVQPFVEKIQAAETPHKLYTLSYFQREFPYILQKIKAKEILLVRGSWQFAFHTRAEYYTLVDSKIPYRMISPFVDEEDARAYESKTSKQLVDRILPHIGVNRIFNDVGMLELASKAARLSYDYTFQTGVALGKKASQPAKGYKYIAVAFNKVMPYQTYALLNGNSREDNFSPPNDLNHYDAVHAETELIIHAQKNKTDLKGTTMFINLLPCPTCARMLAETDIEEFVYSIDHSDGYAIKMLEAAGKTVRRVVT